MKKIFVFGLLFAFSVLTPVSAQKGYRYSTVPGTDNTYAIPHKEIKAISYAATKLLSPTMEETSYNVATLTGAMTFSVTITPCYTADKMTILFVADGSDRVVTFSTGFSAAGTLTVPASTHSAISFVFNGSAWFETSRQNLVSGSVTTLLAGNGTAGAPAISFTSDTDNGIYRVGANELGITEGGSKIVDVNTNGVIVNGTITRAGTVTTYTTTANVTAAAIAGGVIAYTGAAHTLTLPSIASIGAAVGSVTQGTCIDFVLDNSGGSGTVTIALDASETAVSAVTGGTTLTLAQSATAGQAGFRITFISGTVGIISRLY